MSRIDDRYVANPQWPWSYFPYDKERRTVGFGVLLAAVFQEGKPHDMRSYLRELSATEIETLCRGIKDRLKLNYLDWGYIGGRALLEIGLDDLPRVYEVIQAFLDAGRSIYMNDTTQTTLSPGPTPVDALAHQRAFLDARKSQGAWLDKPPKEMRWILNTPFWRDAFWTIPEGKQWAADYRKRHNTADLRGADRDPDDKSFTLSEYFGEKSPAGTPCVICNERTADTMVLPCRHVTVCGVCSLRLKAGNGGPHAATHCVYCNQQIGSILSDVA